MDGIIIIIYYYYCCYTHKQSTVLTLYLYVRSKNFNLVDPRIVSPKHCLVIWSNQAVGNDAFKSNVRMIQRICNHIFATSLT